MKIQRTLLPGQPGTKRLVNQYGDNLVCVRYRYDLVHRQRLTTAEIIIDRQEWTLDPSRTPPNKIINLRIEYGERELAQQVKSLGGRWDSHKKAWKLPFNYVQILNLEDRIIK
jgi:hypothetical protein